MQVELDTIKRREILAQGRGKTAKRTTNYVQMWTLLYKVEP